MWAKYVLAHRDRTQTYPDSAKIDINKTKISEFQQEVCSGSLFCTVRTDDGENMWSQNKKENKARIDRKTAT